MHAQVPLRHSFSPPPCIHLLSCLFAESQWEQGSSSGIFKRTQLRFEAGVTHALRIRQPKRRDNFYRSTTRGQNVTTGNLELATEESTAKAWGEFSRTPGCSSSQFSFGPEARRSLCDYRHSACSGPSSQAVPTWESRHFSATTCLIKMG